MNTILKKHIISLVLSTVLFVGCVFGILFFISSMNNKITSVTTIKEQIASYQKNKKAFDDEAAKLKALENRLSNLESQVVTTETLPSLLSSFESLATKNGTTFEITSVQTPVVDGKTQLLIDFTDKGSYAQVKSFLDQLQHQSFEIKFSKLYLFSDQGETQSQATTGTLSVTKVKAPVVVKEKQWQGVATIEVVSF